MKKRISLLICFAFVLAGLAANNVLRLVPNDGTAQDIPVETLRKVVFTADSMVLIASEGEVQASYYKYDYAAMLFAESEPSTIGQQPESTDQPKAVKFLQNGQFYIRLGDKTFDFTGKLLH